ncbi:MAG: phosphoribosylaminoimidazolesuccinocarboxamide synthase, partial [Pseudomonadota bacterium]
VYWLTHEDSVRLIAQRGYAIAPEAPLGIMVISDRISAFDCIWHGEGGLAGVPGKGAALNAISSHWFSCFREAGLANSHILEIPHPLVWIVQKARPVMIEAIARQYITGSMWRYYESGERTICGIHLPDGFKRDQRLPELLITPSTKGVMKGLAGVPEADDVNVSRDDILNHYGAFGFLKGAEVSEYERLLREGFSLISGALDQLDQIFVDTKFEFGYVTERTGESKLIYMDEVGTPDSSRIWDGPAYREGRIIENSKERFRQLLLSHFPDPDILLNKSRMRERFILARDNALPVEALMSVSETYTAMAEKVIGQKVQISDNPRAEIVELMRSEFDLII